MKSFLSSVFFGLLLLFIAELFQSCTTYRNLPEKLQNPKELESVYYNKSLLNTEEKKETTVWNLIDYKHAIKDEGFTFKLEFIDTKTMSILFVKDSVKIGEKKIKGKLKEDGCFYSRRRFYIIPILPILWAYSNEQMRFYKFDNKLVIENVKNSGGAFIFMAGGHKYNNIWQFNTLP